MTTTPITDLQFAYYQCGMSLQDIAERTGSTPTRLREELAATPVPEWLVASVKRTLTRDGGHSAHQ